MASRLVRANAVEVNDMLDGRKLLEIDCVDRVCAFSVKLRET